MTEKPKEELLNKADELLKVPDREIMALSLGKNERWAENYQMVMTIKLRETLRTLNSEIIKLKKSVNISTWVMSIMTFLILFLTAVLVWKGFN